MWLFKSNMMDVLVSNMVTILNLVIFLQMVLMKIVKG